MPVERSQIPYMCPSLDPNQTLKWTDHTHISGINLRMGDSCPGWREKWTSRTELHRRILKANKMEKNRGTVKHGQPRSRVSRYGSSCLSSWHLEDWGRRITMSPRLHGEWGRVRPGKTVKNKPKEAEERGREGRRGGGTAAWIKKCGLTGISRPAKHQNTKTPKHGASDEKSNLEVRAYTGDIAPLGVFACLPNLCDTETNCWRFRFIVCVIWSPTGSEHVTRKCAA